MERHKIFNGLQDWRDIKAKEQLRKRYASYLPSLMKIAQKCGYALAVHGSMQRDLDLIAAPWSPKAYAPETLIMVLEEAMTGTSHTRAHWKKEARIDAKPHGRKAYAVHVALLNDKFETPTIRHAYLDISVMPRMSQK